MMRRDETNLSLMQPMSRDDPLRRSDRFTDASLREEEVDRKFRQNSLFN